MRSILMISFLFSCFFVHAQNIDTLRHYSVNGGSKSFSPTTYPFQVARFDLPQPGEITGLKIRADGTPGSTMRIHFFGHEAGTSFPQLEADLISPITFTLDSSGSQWHFIMLNDPLHLDNNQFFLAFDDFNGVTMFSDNVSHPISCSSGSGGDYHYQFLKNKSDQWAASDNAFIVDVLYEHEDSLSERYLQDVTTIADLPDDISNRTIATADYNNDDFIDILVGGRLFQNDGDGTFTEHTSQSGISAKNPAGNAIIDIDNDGDMDLVFLDAQDSSWIYVNDGNGIFTEWWVPSLPTFKALNSFSFADLNDDDLPDLFISQLWGTYPEAEPNYLFFNDGFYGFSDQTALIYIDWDGTWNYPNKAWNPSQNIIERNRNSRGSMFVDFDNDDDLDLYITNYFLHQDEFYINENGQWIDACRSKGIDVNNSGSNHGTGVDWYDYDNDGDMDLLLSQFAHPGFQLQYDHRGTTLYSNDGAPNYSFTDMKNDHGIQFEETHAGCSFGDINNDGLVDIATTVYYGCRYMDIYTQKTDHSFEMKSYEYGIDQINTGQDAVWVDFDNDGLLDLACGLNGKFRLFKNQDPGAGESISIDLIPSNSNVSAIGARVKVKVGNDEYLQEVQVGRGQRMQKPYRLHFGTGSLSTVDDISVKWPGTSSYQSYGGASTSQIVTIQESGGSSTAVSEMKPKTQSKVVPNPYTTDAQIRFHIPTDQQVQIRILNEIGQLMWDNNSFVSSGMNSVSLPDLESGIYFYEIIGSDFTERDRFIKVQH